VARERRQPADRHGQPDAAAVPEAGDGDVGEHGRLEAHDRGRDARTMARPRGLESRRGRHPDEGADRARDGHVPDGRQHRPAAVSVARADAREHDLRDRLPLYRGHAVAVSNGDHTSWDRLHGRPQLQRAIVTAGAIDLGTLSQDGAAQGSYQQMTVSGPVTVSFNNVPADPAGSGTNPHIATVFYLKVINGGSNTITWPGTVTWLAGTAPFLRVAGTDLLMFATN